MYEYDRELVKGILDKIIWALDQSQKRTHDIKSADDFLQNDEGIVILDSICMQLINVGEALKQIDKITAKKSLKEYPEIEWKKVMGMRDIITHHYFDVDSEIVFSVCEERIPELTITVQNIRDDISKN